MNALNLPADDITVPEYVERSIDRVNDDLLRKSIERGGIQQPLVVVNEDGRYLLVDGLRRLRVARVLKLPKVPVVVDSVHAGVELQDYIERIRFILDNARQDPLPSQKAQLLDQLKQPPFNFTHKQIAAYVGIAPDSVTNWLAVGNYIEPVKEAVDFGHISLKAARVFDGLTDAGQQFMWKNHRKELETEAGGALHERLRALYPPAVHQDFYRQPGLIAQRLTRKGAKRKGRPRPNLTTDEKRRLMNDLQIREVELREGEAEMDELKKRRNAAIAPISAIMRSEKLRAMLSDDQRDEFSRWIEIYA